MPGYEVGPEVRELGQPMLPYSGTEMQRDVTDRTGGDERGDQHPAADPGIVEPGDGLEALPGMRRPRFGDSPHVFVEGADRAS